MSAIQRFHCRSKICSKLTIKIPELRQWCRSGVFFNSEHILHLALVFLLLTLNMQLPAERESTYVLRSETVSTVTKYTVSMLISENVIWKCLLSSTYWRENPIQRKIFVILRRKIHVYN